MFEMADISGDEGQVVSKGCRCDQFVDQSDCHALTSISFGQDRPVFGNRKIDPQDAILEICNHTLNARLYKSALPARVEL